MTDCLRGVIRSTCTLNLMSQVSKLYLFSDILAQFDLPHCETGFMERDAIHIQLSSKISADFDVVDHFADRLKGDAPRLKKINTKDVLCWMITIWLLHCLSSGYYSFWMTLNNYKKANKQTKETKFEQTLTPFWNKSSIWQPKRRQAKARLWSHFLNQRNGRDFAKNLWTSAFMIVCSSTLRTSAITSTKSVEVKIFWQNFQKQIKELRHKSNSTKVQNGKTDDIE